MNIPTQPGRTNYPNLLGKWLLAVLLLGAGWAQGQAPNLTYSAPLVISKGGTYTGNYRTTSSGTPAIHITTTQPVVLEGCNLTGPGDLIYSEYPNTDITVRNCSGYTTNPTADNTLRGMFLYVNEAKNLVIEHNYFERSKGIIVHRWKGNGSPTQTIRVRYNSARNIDGRIRNGAAPTTGNAGFFQMDKVIGLAGVEVAWNQVINEPNASSVGDGINFYNSSGTSASPIRLHDNYYQGSYPVPAISRDFSGTGMCVDGAADATSTTAAGFINITYNQFVSACNGAINISAGHDVRVDRNRIVTSGFLPDGSRTRKRYAGISNYNYYKQPAGVFGNNTITNNTVGYINHDSEQPNNLDLAPGTTSSGNISLPGPLTYQTEQNEWTLWQQKLKQNTVTPGPLSASTGGQPTPPLAPAAPVTQPTTAPVVTPASPAAATFYRAFNLGGGGLTLDGNNWEAGSGVQVSGGTSFANQNVPLTPATDAARAGMIRASTFGRRIKLSVANVPSASYFVYLYVWEDNGAETFSVSVNGQTVQSNYNSGAAGHWDRLGPFATTVTGGSITVNADNGDANCSGLEIWRSNAAPTPVNTPSPTAGFYRAINLNGDAANIDGNNWEGRAAMNYSVNGIGYGDPNQQLTPATDASRAAMIRSCQTSPGLDFRLSAVPSGTYQVYAYVWEDNYSETYSVAVNGKVVQQNLRSGAAGAWTKLGPYATTVSNGTLQLTTDGGNINVSGVEVWRVGSGTQVETSSAKVASSARVAAAPATLYPNPLSGGQSQVQVEATVPQAQQVQVQVLTRFGAVVLRTSLAFKAGTSSQPLNLGTLPQGDYLVRFVDGSLAGTTINVTKTN